MSSIAIRAQRCAGALVAGILGASLLVLSGCGYALVGRASNLPADIRNVYIRPLENRTPRSQVEQALTRAIAEEMVQRQRFAVLGGPEGADAELSGTVVAFGATPVTFDQSGRATEYEIFLTAQIAFKRMGQDEPIWSNDRYTFRETYPIEATNQDYVDLEDDAIERAAERFAETMVSDLLEGF
jgi:outer membrane lipopolysaccharide assembly protein LptE/RlpB